MPDLAGYGNGRLSQITIIRIDMENGSSPFNGGGPFGLIVFGLQLLPGFCVYYCSEIRRI